MCGLCFEFYKRRADTGKAVPSISSTLSHLSLNCCTCALLPCTFPSKLDYHNQPTTPLLRGPWLKAHMMQRLCWRWHVGWYLPGRSGAADNYQEGVKRALDPTPRKRKDLATPEKHPSHPGLPNRMHYLGYALMQSTDYARLSLPQAVQMGKPPYSRPTEAPKAYCCTAGHSNPQECSRRSRFHSFTLPLTLCIIHGRLPLRPDARVDPLVRGKLELGPQRLHRHRISPPSVAPPSVTVG